MANYLVTGAAGFIGSRVAEMLLEDGHRVLGIDDLNNAYDVRMKYWRMRGFSDYENFNFHQFDIGDRRIFEESELKDYFKRYKLDGIINLAARAGVRQSMEDPWVYLSTNVNGTLNLLELARQFEVPKFVLASTSSLYGLRAPLPTPETADTDHPLQPYAASKKGAEALCHAYHHLYGIDVSIFRYFTVYGPAGRPDMVMFRFIQWIFEGHPLIVYGDGDQWRGFTYIDDIARGTILGLKPVGFDVINLGGHETLKINRLVQILEELSGQKAVIQYETPHPADLHANWANIDKARNLLGWEPLVNLNDGIANTVDWYEAQRSWVKQIKTNYSP